METTKVMENTQALEQLEQLGFNDPESLNYWEDEDVFGLAISLPGMENYLDNLFLRLTKEEKEAILFDHGARKEFEYGPCSEEIQEQLAKNGIDIFQMILDAIKRNETETKKEVQ